MADGDLTKIHKRTKTVAQDSTAQDSTARNVQVTKEKTTLDSILDARERAIEKARLEALQQSEAITTNQAAAKAAILEYLRSRDNRYPNKILVKLNRIPKPLWWSSEKFDAYESGLFNKNDEFTKEDLFGNSHLYYCYKTPTPNTAIFVPKSDKGLVYWSTTGDENGDLGEPLGLYNGTGAMYDRDLWDLYDSYAEKYGTVPVVPSKGTKSNRFGGILDYKPHYFDFFNNKNI